MVLGEVAVVKTAGFRGGGGHGMAEPMWTASMCSREENAWSGDSPVSEKGQNLY